MSHLNTLHFNQEAAFALCVPWRQSNNPSIVCCMTCFDVFWVFFLIFPSRTPQLNMAAERKMTSGCAAGGSCAKIKATLADNGTVIRWIYQASSDTQRWSSFTVKRILRLHPDSGKKGKKSRHFATRGNSWKLGGAFIKCF